jgi:putative resolvase
MSLIISENILKILKINKGLSLLFPYNESMKLSVWAKKQGISYQTAFNWFKAGKLPVSAIQTETSTILVQEPEVKQVEQRIVIYGRVSSHNKKGDLQRQIERCTTFCKTNNWSVAKTFKEVASGMNDRRRELFRMLDYSPTKVVVENKDRLTRFGFNYLEYFLNKRGCDIVVINAVQEEKEDLIKDLISIITSFCCRIYGLRRGRNKSKEVKQILK